MELPKRKSMRLKDFDYSENGAYFITICTQNKECICRGEQCSPELTHIGNIVDIAINNIPKYYDNVIVDKYVIMPNHIHMIIILSNNAIGRTMFAPTVSRIIKQMKEYVTKQLGYSIWQKSFYDHIIRNENEYQKIAQYIDENPLRWQEDCYYK